jgi:glycosyltransferase involved in cell wall biosynthesis
MLKRDSYTDQTMRVCFLVPELPTETITGGAQLQCYLVGMGLEEKGWDVKFATLRCIAGTSVVGGYEDMTGYIWIGKYSRYFVKWAIPVFRFLRRTDPEIVVITGTRVGAFNALGVLCSIWLRKKLVFRAASIMDAEPNFAERLHLASPGFVRRYLYILTLKHVRVIVANAQYVADAFKRVLPRKSIWLIPNGRQIEPVRRSERSHVLWIARFEKVKNPLLFVSLARQLVNIPFVMCGFGSLADDIARRARDLANLTILNSVSDETKRDLLATAFAVVNTSVAEGFPNTLIEAGINAIPYISFVDPDEVICRYRLGFHVTSLSELVQKVELLVQDRDLREQIGSNIRAYVEKHHDINKTVAEYDRLLRSLL